MSEHKTTEMLQEEAAKLWADIDAKKSAGTKLTPKDRTAIPPQESLWFVLITCQKLH